MEKLNLAGRLVGPGEPPYIVAEIGANHNGDLELCYRTIDQAKASGADAVKFQSWSRSSLISEGEYRRNTRYGPDGSRSPGLREAVETYALSADQHHAIADYCHDKGITFFSSCFSREEVDLLDSLDVPAFKIASMDVNHLPLLRYVASKGRPVVLSTGLATLGEVEQAVQVLRAAGSGPIALLHCIAIYPCEPAMVNLANLTTLRQAFDLPVGYSDHTLGTAVSLGAVALGACMIEKHFTLDKKLAGWDHAISADPLELAQLAAGSRAVYESLGSAVRALTCAEIEKRKVFRRRAVLRDSLAAGHVIHESDLEFKRPGTGIRPDELPYIVGRRLTRDLEAEAELEWSDIN